MPYVAGSKQNIIIGAAALFMGLSSATKPVPVAGTRYVDTVDAATGWDTVGFTTEGLEVAYEPDYGDVEVDQLLDSAKTFKSGMRVSMNTTLAEATLDNLVVAWGQTAGSLLEGATGHDGDAMGTNDRELGIESGALGQQPNERQLIAVGNGPELGGATNDNTYRERIYHVRRVLSVDASSHALRRSEATTIPVSFRLLPDADSPGAEYGTIRDRIVGAAI